MDLTFAMSEEREEDYQSGVAAFHLMGLNELDAKFFALRKNVSTGGTSNRLS